ncbi:MAG: RNA 2'-phosphotransferase [Angelakisella sp.]|nr:RNA 2'-phosphotransferase [Angelakisella sp.]
MAETKRDASLGRFLSLVLRHQPEAAFLALDRHGWADVDALLAGCARAGKPMTRQDLERIVRENSKQRYRFNDDKTRIRANQGHSVPVELELREAAPPPVLYHGTALRFLESIRKNGITRQSRQQVHLSATLETAWQVGARHGVPVVLPVDTAAMAADGHAFWLSDNGVWLCREVPWRYIIEGEIIYKL